MLMYLHVCTTRVPYRYDCSPGANIQAFARALQRHASSQRWILLCLVDQGFLDMALSFHIGSLRSHDINNYLMVATDRKSCDVLNSHGVSVQTLNGVSHLNISTAALYTVCNAIRRCTNTDGHTMDFNVN